MGPTPEEKEKMLKNVLEQRRENEMKRKKELELEKLKNKNYSVKSLGSLDGPQDAYSWYFYTIALRIFYFFV